MSTDAPDLPPPPAIDRAAGPALVDRLAAAGYGAPLFAWTSSIGAGHLDPLRFPLMRDALAREGSTGALLASALTYGGPPPSPEAMGEHAALLEELRAANLLPPAGASNGAPRVRVLPFAGMLITADDAAAGVDAVMPPGGTTAELARLLPDCAGKKVLDLGGGPGTLALCAAKEGAARAVSTDVNARTKAFVEANACLNGLRVEAHVGDLFSPVQDDEFDVVVSQPPFLVHPPGAEQVTYLHGGSRGDDVALRAIAELDGMLSPDGAAMFRLDAARDPHDLVDAVRSIDAPGRQTLVVWWPGPAVETFAVVYAAVQYPDLGAKYERLASAYREHLLGFEIDRLASALVVTRRPADDEAPSFLVGFGTSSCPSLWDEIAAAFATFDLSMRPDEDLLGARICPHPDLLVAERRAPGRGIVELRAELPHGAIGWRSALEPDAVALLDLVATTPEVADIVRAFAQSMDLDTDTAVKAVLPRLRDALQVGLLISD